MKQLLYITLLGFLIASCGGGTDSSSSSADTSDELKPQPKKEQPKAASGGEKITVELKAGDEMKYDTKLIKVKEGQSVTVNLTHTGQMEEKMMGHNFVLLKQYTDVTEFAGKATAAYENEYIPEDTENIIAYTEMIGGGESTSVTFDAPKKGVYDFICSFPGHYGLMNGKFIVE
ncbi:MAG: azurin [Bacteroidota bacterium]